jgi:2-oxoglutarate/2-oxoacid ferredoxin oxidoreductase subunit alpha
MAHAGEGYRFHVTGLTHDEAGYPAMNVPAQDKLVRRLWRKWMRTDPLACSRDGLEDADVVVVSYGITSRVAQRAVELARAGRPPGRQVPADHRLAFPGTAHRELAARVKRLRGPGVEPGPDGAGSGARRRRGTPAKFR